MDESNNPPFEKIIRKLAAIAKDINSDEKISEKKCQNASQADDLNFDYTPQGQLPGWNQKIKVNPSREKRTYARKSCFLSVDYATNDRAYQEFIQNISTAGAFIETRCPLPIGQNIAMTFSFPSSQKNIKLNGSIARISSQGLGVAFVFQDSDQKNYLRSQIADM